VFVPLHIVQHKDRSGTRRKAGNRPFKVEGGLGVVPDHRVGSIRLIVDDLEYRPSASRPEVPQNHIDGDPVKPGGKEAVASKGVEFLPRPDIALLGQLFREVGVTAHPETEAVNPTDRCAIEFLKRSYIADAGAINRLIQIDLSTHRGRGPKGNGGCKCFHITYDALCEPMV